MALQKPLHEKIKTEILNSIRKGELASNQKLPSETTLSNMYCVSRATIRSALQSLSDEGVIIKQHGSGSFVQPKRHIYSSIEGFARMSANQDSVAVLADCRTRILKSDAKIAGKLDIEHGDNVLEVKKAMMSDGKFSNSVTEYFPTALLESIPASEQIGDSIRTFINDYCHRQVARILTDITPISAGKSPFGSKCGCALRFDEVFLDENDDVLAYAELFQNASVIQTSIIRT